MRALLLVLLLLGFAPAQATDLSQQDAKAIRGVIAGQLDAFKRDDAARAFALASSSIRAQFGTPENFLYMVRSSYPVVYRPRSVQFEQPELVDGIPVQAVRMTDADGRGWIAIYPMQREKDGRWRINGCQLARMPGSET
jgi:hypothetical protein